MVVDPNIPKTLFAGVLWTIILWQVTRLFKIEHATLGRAALLALFSAIINYVAITFIPPHMFWLLLILNMVIFTAILKAMYELSVRYAVTISLSHWAISVVVVTILGTLIELSLGINVFLTPKFSAG
jgi:hypothetical protein